LAPAVLLVCQKDTIDFVLRYRASTATPSYWSKFIENIASQPLHLDTSKFYRAVLHLTEKHPDARTMALITRNVATLRREHNG
jgi:hypothetical protein